MNTPDDLTATGHLEGLTRSVRRANGQVYTPQAVADFVLNQASVGRRVPFKTVLDPACGAGVFLISLIRRFAMNSKKAGLDIANDYRDSFLQSLEDNLWGIDVDPIAVELCRKATRAEVLRLSPGSLPSDFMLRNLLNADFLFDNVKALLPVEPQLIVGNPPYVSVDRLAEETRKLIRARFPSARGRIDLYTVFMERAADLLPIGGRMAFITPDKFLVSESSRFLRAFLGESGTVRSVTLFASHQIFGDAATVPAVTVWDRIKDDRDVRVAQAHVDGDQKPVMSSAVKRISVTRFRGARWTISRAQSETLKTRLTRGLPRLSELSSRISAGPATGYNPAFILDGPVADSIEQELLHPTIRGRDIRRGDIAGDRQVMLIPYRQTDAGNLELIDLDSFPGARRWLEVHKRDLLKRHCVRAWGKEWWDLHDPITGPLYSIEKIVFPDVARSNRFALDEGRFVPQHSAYYIVPAGIDAHYLTALLNSSCEEYLIRSQAPVVKDGFSRYRKQFILDLPVPRPDPAVQAEIISALLDDRKDLLDKLVANIFKVDSAEVEEALNRLPIARD